MPNTNSRLKIMVLNILLALLLCLPVGLAYAGDQIPHLDQSGNCTKLIVNDKPFLMIAGELHNSNASTIEYMAPLMKRLKAMHLNTVLAPIAWEQFEPEEGVYDYTLIDGMIKEAEANDLKLVVIWFATWKNGQSSYAPIWVKRDTKRFERVQTKEGLRIETLSPFCDATRKADATAFAALMSRIKQVNQENVVIMAQPENEVGILQDMDYSPAALEALEGEVPLLLIEYLQKKQDKLTSAIDNIWAKQGRLSTGNWTTVFGDTPQAREFLLAWQMASFIEDVVKAGQQEYPLPMFVNAWIVQKPDDLPGVYPNGGPVARVMDIYKAAAPSIFTLCPDIYLANFKEICAEYVREDNPLLIPESTVDAGRAFYAFAEHDAICYSPFAIERRAYIDLAYQQAYAVLGELHDTIVANQGSGNMKGLLREGVERSEQFTMGKYIIKVFYQSETEPCYGLVIQEADHEFLVSGVNLRVEFHSEDESVTGYIGYVREVRKEGDQWHVIRVLNGDETYHHSSLRVFGRETTLGTNQSDLIVGPQPTADDPIVAAPLGSKIVQTPGIYRVTTYIREK